MSREWLEANCLFKWQILADSADRTQKDLSPPCDAKMFSWSKKLNRFFDQNFEQATTRSDILPAPVFGSAISSNRRQFKFGPHRARDILMPLNLERKSIFYLLLFLLLLGRSECRKRTRRHAFPISHYRNSMIAPPLPLMMI